MEQADWLPCKSAGMSSEYYNYSIDPETLEIKDISETEDSKFFKKVSGRIRFNSIKTKDAKTTKSGAEQKAFLQFLLSSGRGFYGSPKKLLICSDQTDKIPMIVASCMAQMFLTASSKSGPIFINPFTKVNNEDRPILTARKDGVGHNHVTIHGISGTSNDYKLQEVRDILSSITWSCSVVLVVGGVLNPIEFYKKKLNMEMDAVLSIADSIQI